jgi:hypothetical protein
MHATFWRPGCMSHQAAWGLLFKVRDLGLSLISVNPVAGNPDNSDT